MGRAVKGLTGRFVRSDDSPIPSCSLVGRGVRFGTVAMPCVDGIRDRWLHGLNSVLRGSNAARNRGRLGCLRLVARLCPPLASLGRKR